MARGVAGFRAENGLGLVRPHSQLSFELYVWAEGEEGDYRSVLSHHGHFDALVC